MELLDQHLRLAHGGCRRGIDRGNRPNLRLGSLTACARLKRVVPAAEQWPNRVDPALAFRSEERAGDALPEVVEVYCPVAHVAGWTVLDPLREPVKVPLERGANLTALMPRQGAEISADTLRLERCERDQLVTAERAATSAGGPIFRTASRARTREPLVDGSVQTGSNLIKGSKRKRSTHRR